MHFVKESNTQKYHQSWLFKANIHKLSDFYALSMCTDRRTDLDVTTSRLQNQFYFQVVYCMNYNTTNYEKQWYVWGIAML